MTLAENLKNKHLNFPYLKGPILLVVVILSKIFSEGLLVIAISKIQNFSYN